MQLPPLLYEICWRAHTHLLLIYVDHDSLNTNSYSTLSFHPVIFKVLDYSVICAAALHIKKLQDLFGCMHNIVMGMHLFKSVSDEYIAVWVDVNIFVRSFNYFSPCGL